MRPEPAIIRVEPAGLRSGKQALAVDRPSLLILLALTPSVLVQAPMPDFALRLGGAILVAFFWALLFARIRRRPVNLFLIPAAMLFALLVPPGTLWLPAMAAFSAGIILGEQVFGGRGQAFLHPAAAGLAFLLMAFGDATGSAELSALPGLAALPGIAMLMAAGLISWRSLAGLATGLLVCLPGELPAGALILAAGFLIADPYSSPALPAGRLVHGFLAGSLMIALGGSHQAVLLAAFIASLAAPLVDSAVTAAYLRRRRARLDRS